MRDDNGHHLFVDILQFDQPCLHDIKNLGKKYAGKVTFCCPVDMQLTLPTKNKEFIAMQAHELVRNLHRNGGFIAKIPFNWMFLKNDFNPVEYSEEIFKSINLMQS